MIIILKFELAIIISFITVFPTLSISNSSSGEAYVDGGSLVSMTSILSIPDQLRSDFLESVLYAQVNASSKYDRQVDGSNWYKAYLDILHQVGWNINISDFRVNEMNGIFDWKNAIESILNDELSPSQTISLDRVLTAYLQLPAHNGIVNIFSLFSKKNELASFQVIPAVLKENGELVALFGHFHFIQIAHEQTTYKTQPTELLASTSIGILNTNVYGKYRQQIHVQLAEFVKEYIYKIQY